MIGSVDDGRAFRRAVVGSTLQRVTYEQLAGGGLADRPTGAVHEVDTAVRLELESLSIDLTWDHFDGDERLAITYGPLPGGELVGGMDTVLLDVSEAWAGYIGQPIQDVSLAWQHGGVGRSANLWSVRLTFHNARHVVCCLGELDAAARPTYSAETLLLFFDESAADYVTAGGIGSAWGEPVNS